MRTIAEKYIDKASGEEVELPKEQLDLRKIKQLVGMGWTHERIAQKFGTTKQVIDNMLYRDRKKKKEEAEAPKKRGRPPGSKNKRTLAEEKMLTNWQNSPAAPMMREDKAELNKAAGWFVAQCWQLGKTVNHEDPDSMMDALEKYVMLCTQCGMPMLVKTCHLALGLNSNTVTKWRNGTYRANDPRYKNFVEVMDAVVNAGIESAAAAGSIDRVLTIWWEKAHFNMVEGNGLSAEKDDPLGEKKSASEIAERYKDLLPEDN